MKGKKIWETRVKKGGETSWEGGRVNLRMVSFDENKDVIKFFLLEMIVLLC